MKKCIVWFVLIGIYAFGYDGIIHVKNSAKLSLQIDGVVETIFAKEGAKIVKDYVVLKLDDSLQKLEVQRRKSIFDDNAEYESNKKNLILAKSLYESTKSLYEKTASVSKDELSNIEMQYQSLLGKVNSYEARKEQEKVEYNIAKEVLSKYELTSPINGIVTSLEVQKGEWAKSGDILAIVVDNSVCYVELNIDEKTARRLKVHQKSFISSSGHKKQGHITYISPIADKASGLIKVKVEFENQSSSFISGTLAQVYF
jgi:RND family efflux transporter MFP subunit